jgi:hypothetical protein
VDRGNCNTLLPAGEFEILNHRAMTMSTISCHFQNDWENSKADGWGFSREEGDASTTTRRRRRDETIHRGSVGLMSFVNHTKF